MWVIVAAFVIAAAAMTGIVVCIYASRTAGGRRTRRAAVAASAGFIAGCRGARYRSRACFGCFPRRIRTRLIVIGYALFVAVFAVTAGVSFTGCRAVLLGCPGIARAFLNGTNAARFYTFNLAIGTILVDTIITA